MIKVNFYLWTVQKGKQTEKKNHQFSHRDVDDDNDNDELSEPPKTPPFASLPLSIVTEAPHSWIRRSILEEKKSITLF